VGLNLQFDRSQEVTLSQIEATGTRLPVPSVLSSIQQAQTKKWLSDELSRGSRTYVIYEVYIAKSLSVRTINDAALNIGLPVKSGLAAGTDVERYTAVRRGMIRRWS
jgi:hypothetical protein